MVHHPLMPPKGWSQGTKRCWDLLGWEQYCVKQRGRTMGTVRKEAWTKQRSPFCSMAAPQLPSGLGEEPLAVPHSRSELALQGKEGAGWQPARRWATRRVFIAQLMCNWLCDQGVLCEAQICCSSRTSRQMLLRVCCKERHHEAGAEPGLALGKLLAGSGWLG